MSVVLRLRSPDYKVILNLNPAPVVVPAFPLTVRNRTTSSRSVLPYGINLWIHRSVFLTCYPISLQKNKPMYWNKICLDGISFILGFFFFFFWSWGFPGSADGEESDCRARGPGFHPWVRKIPWRNGPCPSILAWRIPWTEGPGGLYNPWGHKESDTTEQLSINSLKRVKVPCSQLTWAVFFFLNLLNAGELPKLYWFALLYTCSSENKLSFT